MNFFSNEIGPQEIEVALDQACALGWVEKVNHGYCFHCHSEKVVYDIIDPTAPVQPPRCAACFERQAKTMIAENPDLVKEILAEIENDEFQ
jgi:hypothetical protein